MNNRGSTLGGIALVLCLSLSVVLLGCSGQERPEGGRLEGESEAFPNELAETEGSAVLSRSPGGTPEDWAIFDSTVTWAWREGLDTLPMGQTMVQLGLRFVGTPYVPGTLEVEGRESVVVNFEGFDCVTLVENVLALARFIKTETPAALQSGILARETYRRILQEIRYRGARVDGYASRLHYFSDWIRDNEAKGLVREVTSQMGGVEDIKGIDYMSTHPDAYRQLAEGTNFRLIQEVEFDLSVWPRFKIPEEDISQWESDIQNGDIIAATSNAEGLDVAHTGLAYWVGQELHLIHAPLVGDSVEVSERPLSERILRLEGQDGIRVVRPLAPGGPATGDPRR